MKTRKRKMKKRRLTLLTTALLILCLASAACAETTVAAPFPAGSAEAALTARIAETLGADYVPADENAPTGSDGRSAAANRMLEEPETLLCDTQAALMAALQGYTKEDLRTAMTPVCRIARSPLYLIMDAAAAGEKGIDGSESFLAYLAENEYDDSLLLARHVEADPVDRAVTFLSNELPLLTDVFWPADIPDALKNGEAALAVCTEAELCAAEPGDLLVLFTLGSERTETHPEVPALTEAGLEASPEPALYLMAKSGTDSGLLEEAARKISETDLSADCLAAGYFFDPLSGDALAAEISDVFADYVDYMTAEGLYFYEQ